MLTLDELIAAPIPVDGAAEEQARARWDAVAKPLHSLGVLEDAVVRIAGFTGNADVRIDKRALLVFCADHGITARGVTQCGSEVTARVADAIAAGRSTINPMARLARCGVFPVDMGIRNYTPVKGVVSCRIGNGTADISDGPAMSRTDCIRAIEAGADFVRQLKDKGFHILAVGEMGIGNTSAAAAMASALLRADPEPIVGRGAGLSDAGLERKRRSVRTALERNRPDPDDPVDVLSKVGGFEIAAMCGAFLGAGAYRIPILIDGMISSVAALCAVRLQPAVKAGMLATHLSSEPAGETLLRALGLEAPINAGMHLGEGSGAVAFLPLLDMALAVYHSGQTFDKLGIAAYTPQN